MINYGDFYTSHLAWTHGVPVLALPLHGDQFDVAARISEKKLGLVIDNAHELASSSGHVLRDLIRSHASRLISDARGNLIAKQVALAAKSFRMDHSVEQVRALVDQLLELDPMVNQLKPVWYQLPLYRLYNLDLLLILFGGPTLFTTVFFCIFGYKYLSTSGWLDKVKKD